MKFLQQVARYFTESFDGLDEWTFVFPNKRSAMFLKKYLQEELVRNSSRPFFMPRFQTMGNFVAGFASKPEMSRDEQLFLLYDCYRRLLLRLGRVGQLRDFDKFAFWGTMILDDFDDVDRQLVDASRLFKNLKDLKEINADYLDDEQKKIVRRIWGETARTEAVAEFWTHVGSVEGDSAEARFVALWEILAELYADFRKALTERGFDTAGGQYREAAIAVSRLGLDDLSGRHVAFIGFEDLSHSEILMLNRLKDLGVASFFWDFDTQLLKLAAVGHLRHKIDKLLRIFPMPDGFNPEPCNNLPQIEVVAVPSAIAQAKSVSDILEKWNSEGHINAVGVIDTAVVLPDEKLLTPLLLSVPESIPAVNITMGMSFDSTPFAAMLHSIISMQMHSREIHGVIHYYFADVMELLSHPHIQVIAPKTAEAIRKYISDNNLFNIRAEQLCSMWPDLAYLFTPVKSTQDSCEISNYMVGLISGISDALSRNARPVQGGLPEIAVLDYFKTELQKLNDLIVRYDITMSEGTYFSLFEKLMRSRRLEFQGTPLRGLQIMGVLETRVLDFENIVILSMNENTFPRKSYMRTMIPNNLRLGYGLTTIDHQDQLYTYYFYRLLSRAARVKLIYDSRAGSFGAGEPSRYIAQMRHILPQDAITFRTLQFHSDINSPEPVVIEKDREVCQQLSRFKPGGNGYLSASALKEYKKCRLRFYLRYVKNLRGDEDMTDYISPATYGTIMHKIVERLYTPYEGKTITASIIDSFLANTAALDNLIAKTVFDLYYRGSRYVSPSQMPAEGNVTCTIIGLYIRKMLELERDTLVPFGYVKGEMAVKSPPEWKISDDLSVNFKMSIDRIDEISPKSLRFIDYKTGGDEVKPTDIEKLFSRGRHDDDAVFQLLTYCVAYSDLVDASVKIKPVVYPFRKMTSEGVIPQVKVNGDVISDFHMVEADFRKELFAMISEIFNPEVPFDQVEDAKKCQYCPFVDLCGRAAQN